MNLFILDISEYTSLDYFETSFSFSDPFFLPKAKMTYFKKKSSASRIARHQNISSRRGRCLTAFPCLHPLPGMARCVKSSKLLNLRHCRLKGTTVLKERKLLLVHYKMPSVKGYFVILDIFQRGGKCTLESVKVFHLLLFLHSPFHLLNILLKKKIHLILMALFTSLRNIFSVFFGFVFVVKVPHAQCSDSVDLC